MVPAEEISEGLTSMLLVTVNFLPSCNGVIGVVGVNRSVGRYLGSP